MGTSDWLKDESNAQHCHKYYVVYNDAADTGLNKLNFLGTLLDQYIDVRRTSGALRSMSDPAYETAFTNCIAENKALCDKAVAEWEAASAEFVKRQNNITKESTVVEYIFGPCHSTSPDPWRQ